MDASVDVVVLLDCFEKHKNNIVYVQVDIAQCCQYNYITAQKQTKWLINNVMHRFQSMMIIGAIILNSELD